MAKSVMIDELHLTAHIPNNLPQTQVEEVRRTLASVVFMRRLRRAVRALLRQYGELAEVRVTVGR